MKFHSRLHEAGSATGRSAIRISVFRFVRILESRAGLPIKDDWNRLCAKDGIHRTLTMKLNTDVIGCAGGFPAPAAVLLVLSGMIAYLRKP